MKMEQKIKIAVIGGSGKSGKYLVKLLLDQGFHLKVLLRNPDAFQIKSPLIEVVKGNVLDYDSIHSLIEDCQAVISTLGLGLPASEPTIFSQSTTNVVKAMNECHISRYIVTTGLNVDTPFDKKSSKTHFATDWMKKTFPISTTDKQLEYDILVGSNLDWTLVRLPLIEQTDDQNQVIIDLEDCIGDKISATDLANFLIEQLSSKTFINKSPFVSNR
jgi:putative NADH-flavin reductase